MTITILQIAIKRLQLELKLLSITITRPKDIDENFNGH